LDCFKPLFSNTLLTSLSNVLLLLLLLIITSESPKTVRHIYSIKKVILTLAPLPFYITPLLFKLIAARAWSATPFKLIP
jgi:hypothetical protein